MITVLHVIDTTGPGGAETVFVELADRIRDKGFRSVAMLRGEGWVSAALEQRELVPILLDAQGSFNWRYLLSLCRVIRRERVDVVQSHLLGSNVYCALAGSLTGTPVVATFHGAVDISATERFRRLKFMLMQRAVHRYVAVSSSLATLVAEQRLLDPGRTTVIHNGIDIGRYRRPRDRELVQELGLPSDAVIAGSVGNVRPAKAYDVLIRAAARLCSDYPRLHFVIAGHIKKEVMAPLEVLLAELRIAERVHFVGYRTDTPSFLSGLDLFVLSSRSEGFSIATIEAQAAGLPVVATRSGGPEEIIEHEENGVLVPCGDPAALADAIDRVLTDPELAARIAESGRRTVAERFSIEAMVKAYEHLYRDCLNAGRGAAC